MSQQPLDSPNSGPNPFFFQVFSFSALFLGCFLAGEFGAVALTKTLFEIDVTQLVGQLHRDWTATEVNAMRFSAFIGAVLRFALPVVLFYTLIAKNRSFKEDFITRKPLYVRPLFYIVFIVFSALVIAYNLSEINGQLELPSVLNQMEETVDHMISQLVEQKGIWAKIGNFLVISLSAGLIEELLFRGLIQRGFSRLFGNDHLAIWTAAFIFSFIHFEFQDFLPRMFLGAVFGFIYLYSGNLIYPILAHSFFNGLSLWAMYNIGEAATESAIQESPVYVLFMNLLFFGIWMFFFKRYFDRKKELRDE